MVLPSHLADDPLDSHFLSPPPPLPQCRTETFQQTTSSHSSSAIRVTGCQSSFSHFELTHACFARVCLTHFAINHVLPMCWALHTHASSDFSAHFPAHVDSTTLTAVFQTIAFEPPSPAAQTAPTRAPLVTHPPMPLPLTQPPTESTLRGGGSGSGVGAGMPGFEEHLPGPNQHSPPRRPSPPHRSARASGKHGMCGVKEDEDGGMAREDGMPLQHAAYSMPLQDPAQPTLSQEEISRNMMRREVSSEKSRQLRALRPLVLFSSCPARPCRFHCVRVCLLCHYSTLPVICSLSFSLPPPTPCLLCCIAGGVKPKMLGYSRTRKV
jgi:hypothetical protein